MDSSKREKHFKCDDCVSAFRTEAHLKDHHASVHSELRPFQCEHCDYSAKVKGTLRSHYATHFPQTYKRHSCPQCSFKCLRPGKLQDHIRRIHTKEKPFVCPMCPHRTSVRSLLTTHIMSHTDEKPFKCPLCTSTFTKGCSLKRHTLFVHNKNKVILIACSAPGCDSKFTDKHNFRKHVEYFHKKQTHFSCPYCQKAFYRKSNCFSHIRQRHTSERPYKCSVCDYAAARSSHVKTHEATTHGEYMALECPICHKKFRNNNTLARHQSYAHNNAIGSKKEAPKWACKESGCTKEYTKRYSLQQHVNSFHHKQKPFKCLFCELKTTTSYALNVHLRRHTQEKPYNCDLCKRKFISSGQLSTHKVTAHSELRPFQCGQCSYRGKTKNYLKNHQKTHEPKQTDRE